MDRQTNNAGAKEELKMTPNPWLRKRVLALLAVLLVGTSLTTMPRVSAHDMDLEQSRKKLEPYVRSVVMYGRYRADAVNKMSCRKEYPHRTQCTLQYQNEQDFRAGRITCSENIMVYFMPHKGGGRDWTYYNTHTGSQKCGKEYLSGPQP